MDSAVEIGAMSQEEKSEIQGVQVCEFCGRPKRLGTITAWIFGREQTTCTCSDPSQNYLNKERLHEEAVETIPVELKNLDKIVADRYEILKQIGCGGMGAVHLAEDLYSGEHVAIKTLHPHLLANQQVIKRFHKEIAAITSLKHEGIVAVHEYGVSKDGYPFVVMDLLKGKGLDQFQDSEQELAPEETYDVFMQVAAILAYAHKRHIIHRDLKPSNIIVSRSLEGRNEVCLVDFGIAKIMPHTTSDGLSVTQTGEVVGTPFYMSPEQCAGHEVDHRSDIYSLGCVMYEMVAGSPPFGGVNPIQVILNHIHQAPEPLVSASEKDKQRKAFNYIVLRCLEKSPAMRYQSADDLREDLVKLIHDVDSIEMKRSGKAELVRVFGGVGRLLQCMQLPVITVGLIGAVVLSLNSGLPDLFGGENSLESRWRKLDCQGQKLFDQGELERASEVFEKSLDLAGEESSREQFQLASMEELLDLSRASGDEKRADEYMRRINYARSGFERSCADTETALNNALTDSPLLSGEKKTENLLNLCQNANDVAVSLVESGNSELAEHLLSKVLAVLKTRLNSPGDLIVRTLHNLGYAGHSFTAERREKVEGYYLAAMAVAIETYGENNLEWAKSALMLARYRLQHNYADPDDTEKMLLKTQAIFRKVLGPENPRLAWTKFHLASLYQMTDRNQEAMNEINAAIAIYELGKENHSQDHSRELARCYSMRGSINSSIGDYRKALDLQEKAVSKDYPFLLETLTALGIMIRDFQPAEAEGMLKRAFAISDRMVGMEMFQYKQRIASNLAVLREQQADSAGKERFERLAKLYRARMNARQDAR